MTVPPETQLLNSRRSLLDASAFIRTTELIAGYVDDGGSAATLPILNQSLATTL